MITCKILAHSINTANQDLITWELTYPRFIHSELMTYKLAVKNAASSRAIPVAAMLRAIEAKTAKPEAWGKNQKGMSAEFSLDEAGVDLAKYEWQLAAESAIAHARKMAELGAHKQIVNRLVEPFAHMTTIFTSTGDCLTHLFQQRCDPAAQPEFMVLAYRMLDTYLKSEAEPVKVGHWHLPLITKTERLKFAGQEKSLLAKVSAARLARVSYILHNKPATIAEDLSRFDLLVSRGHWSPLEHPCTPRPNKWSAGFNGWKQLRKFYSEKKEFAQPVNLRKLLEDRPDWVTLADA